MVVAVYSADPKMQIDRVSPLRAVVLFSDTGRSSSQLQYVFASLTTPSLIVNGNVLTSQLVSEVGRVVGANENDMELNDTDEAVDGAKLKDCELNDSDDVVVGADVDVCELSEGAGEVVLDDGTVDKVLGALDVETMLGAEVDGTSRHELVPLASCSCRNFPPASLPPSANGPVVGDGHTSS